MLDKFGKKIFVIILLGIFGFFICSRLFFFKKSFLENLSATLAYPVISLSSKITNPFKKIFEKRKKYKELKTIVQKLDDENEKLLSENIKLKASLNYKELSTELVNFQKRYDLKTGILGKILVKNITSSQHYLLLNKGEVDGVAKDMVAIYKFQLVGRVVECYKHYCKVLIITDSNCKVSAFANSNNAQGIVHGSNKKNSCELAYVSHLFKIEKGDFVLSSGQGLIFPEGFCIGKIKNCETKDLCHNIEIETLVDFDKLDFCLLINREQGISF